MTDERPAADDAWVPESCSLPTAERPVRLAEFDSFFAVAVRWFDRPSAQRLRLHLTGTEQAERSARDLAARESACCSFFTFEVTRSGPDAVTMEARVPASHVGILDALTERVRSGGTPTGGGTPAPDAPWLRSGQLATAAGVNPQTLRYYERRGLLSAPRRSPGGHRLYPADAVTRLRVVKTAQRLGFTLGEVADLLDAGRHEPGAGLPARARAKLAEVERRLVDLTAVRDTLRAAVEAGCDDLVDCAGTSWCPLPFPDPPPIPAAR
ncbi:MerR family transcriptional regulator [Micromonospora sp. WMMD710]|uniref:MerR family transcriptional regulator n=1 Tax=Micromonospora sp. WMMD710 TaxID=3016085 RepID=UPI002417E23D|nr:MerR family transcriptional regulator [Micromonospora sp. WMMD710]MDG4761900.1 MerR family transcriptional regulator [Micromonospora sp. WMMD710]